MFKSYIPSIIGFLMAVGALIFVVAHYNSLEPDNIKYSCAFNSATVKGKLIGKKYDDISQRYLPAESVKKKPGKGNFIAHYENIRIFTKGERTLVRKMDVTFRDSLAVSVAFDEPIKSWDARIANLCPFVFPLINAEFLTRDASVAKTTKAEGWQIPLLLLLLLVLVNLPFLLTWPLATLLAKKMEYPWSGLVAVVGWIVLMWLYYGIIAYANGSALLFIILGTIWLIIASRSFRNATQPYDDSIYPSSSSDYDSPSQSEQDPVRLQDYVYHMQNLACIISLSAVAKNISEARAAFVTEMAMREGINQELFSQILHNANMNYHAPSYPYLADEFMDNLAKILLCDSTYSKVQLGAALTIAKNYGLSAEDFMNRMKTVAMNTYHRSLDSYDMIG